MFSEILLSQVRAFKKQDIYKKLNGVSKEVTAYLLQEVEDISKNHRLAVHRIAKNKPNSRREVSLFTLKFEFGALYVHTFHKSGAMHIKCIKNCDVDSTLGTIQKLCEFTGWQLIPENNVNRKSIKLNIIYVPEDETP
ncbi:MAG: hypothetical protein K1W33_02130 [Clostridia bacterium]